MDISENIISIMQDRGWQDLKQSEVAHELGICVGTMIKRLAACGTSWRKIRNDLQGERYRAVISAHSGTPPYKLASKLGFSAQHAYNNRKRWSRKI